MMTYEDVVKICFLKRNGFGTKYVYELNIKESKETIMDISGCKINNLDKNLIKVKGEKLYNIMKDWNRQYVNQKILDGMEYTFVIEFNSGEMFNVYCKNKFPENFGEFVKNIGEN